MSVRKATSKDVFRIAEIGAASWRATFKGLAPDDMLASIDIEESAQRWEICIRDWPDNVLVFENEWGLSGWVCAGPVSAKSKLKEFDGEIFGLHTDPFAPRFGAGTALMKATFNSLKTRNCLNVHVLVLKENDNAVRFYRDKLGGQLHGEYTADFGGRLLPELAFKWAL